MRILTEGNSPLEKMKKQSSYLEAQIQEQRIALRPSVLREEEMRRVLKTWAQRTWSSLSRESRKTSLWTLRVLSRNIRERRRSLQKGVKSAKQLEQSTPSRVSPITNTRKDHHRRTSMSIQSRTWWSPMAMWSPARSLWWMVGIWIWWWLMTLSLSSST